MHRTSCLNCSRALFPNQHYCPHCGQKTDTKRITFRQLTADFLQFILHAERGLWRLLKGLIVRPGQTAIEYVEGKRKRYFNPFAFLALSLAAMVLIHSFIKPYEAIQEPDPFVEIRMPNERVRELYRTTVHKIASIQKFGNANLNTLSVLVSPYFAFFLWLFFKRRGRNVAEITVVYILYTAISNLLASIIISPILAGLKDSGAYWPVFYLSLFLQTCHIVWGLNTFFNYRTTNGYFKILGALFLIGVIGFIILMGSLFVYVYHGKYMEVLKYLG